VFSVRGRNGLGVLSTLLAAAALVAATATPASAHSLCGASCSLSRAVHRLVLLRDGPPGVIVLVRQGNDEDVYRAGTAIVGRRQAITVSDHMRLASVSKAYSGAVALSLVDDRTLSLADTVGRWLPRLPHAWSAVTLRELLSHTSGIPDFSQSAGFRRAVGAAPFDPPPPVELLSYVTDKRLLFRPGTEFRYSNSDNVIVGLMVEAASGHSYEQELQKLVFDPLRLGATTLPRDQVIASPYLHGYTIDPPAAPADDSEAFSAGWAWAAGGIVATPSDMSAFMRAYADGAVDGLPASSPRERYVPGSSEPPGPGDNAVGLAVFRYTTPCGTVYGHTGNTAGYTQFVAATANGQRSVAVSVNAQITPRSHPHSFESLRKLYSLAVCAALAN